jgi:hypothetical protein
LVESAVPRGTSPIGAVKDAVAVVLLPVHWKVGDARCKQVDVEALGGLLGRHDGGAGRGIVHVASKAAKLGLLRNNRLGLELVKDVAGGQTARDDA